MKRFTLYFVLIALSVCWGCGDNEDSLTPSGLEKNWLVVKDDPNDEIDHLRYLIFQETGIPIYYNDTVGSETRYSVMGEAFTYYEVLQVFYTPGGTKPGATSANYTLVQQREDIKPVLEFLRTEVLPMIPETMLVPSILLVDALKAPSGDKYCYKGFNAYVLSEVQSFGSMTEEERKLYRGTFLATMVAGGLLNEEYEWLEADFFALTYAVNPATPGNLYSEIGSSGLGSLRYVYSGYNGITPAVPAADQTLGGLGFIGTKTPASGVERNWSQPMREQDVQQYCRAIFAYTEEEFAEKYKKFPVVMDKYRVMREKLESYGFTFE